MKQQAWFGFEWPDEEFFIAKSQRLEGRQELWHAFQVCLQAFQILEEKVCLQGTGDSLKLEPGQWCEIPRAGAA